MSWISNILFIFSFFHTTMAFSQGHHHPHHKHASSKYRSIVDMEKAMIRIAKSYSNASLIKIGETRNGQNLLVLKIKSKKSSSQPGVFIVGGHHGNEGPSPEVVLELGEDILRSPDFYPWMQRDLYLMPMASPGAIQQKSRFTQQFDLNRDYPYPGRPKSNPAFQTFESRSIDAFLLNTNISHAITVHTGLRAVLYPNGFKDGGLDPIIQDKFESLAEKSAQAMGIQKFLPMWKSYPTYGAFVDYAYHRHGILALNFEIAAQHTPPEEKLVRLSQTFQKGVQAFFKQAFSKDATIAEAIHKVPQLWPQSKRSVQAQ